MTYVVTSTVPQDTEEVSVATLQRAMVEIGLLVKPDQWILLDPQGRMYKGTVEELFAVLVREHPLMRTSFALSGQ